MKKLYFLFVLLLNYTTTYCQPNLSHVVDTVNSLNEVPLPVRPGMEVVCNCNGMDNIYVPGKGWVAELDSIHVKSILASLFPYTAYHAIITQTGTSAPTVVREDSNFVGKTFTWARTGTGTYTLTSSSPVFTSGKTAAFISNQQTALNVATYTITSSSVITFATSVTGLVSLIIGSVSTDALFNNTGVEIRIYN